jgi:hypothetical protein
MVVSAIVVGKNSAEHYSQPSNQGVVRRSVYENAPRQVAALTAMGVDAPDDLRNASVTVTLFPAGFHGK